MCEPLTSIFPRRQNLHIAPCTYSEARFAAENFHYTKSISNPDARFFGVWENCEFIGAVTFGSGTARLLPKSFGLEPAEVFELTRVALTDHKAPVSKIVSIAIKEVRKVRPRLRLLYSYADPFQGHHGGIYQALGFIYTGVSSPMRELIVDGKVVHSRTAGDRYGTAAPAKITAQTGLPAHYGEKRWKHRYLLPFDEEVKALCEAQRKPYPKRPGQQAGLNRVH